MTLLLTVTAVLAVLVIGVSWSAWRLFREVSRYEDWDYPPIKQKREGWK